MGYFDERAIREKGVTFSTEQKLRPELGRDERLLWAGMPGQGLRFRGSDWLMVPFSLLWGGFAFFWEFSVTSVGNAPLVMKLWGIPFVLMGFYITVGRFFADSFQRARTDYGVTDQRVIIVDGLFGRRVKSLALAGLADISLSERSDGSGTITFGAGTGPASWLGGYAWPGMRHRQPPAFEMIPDARRIYTLIREAQQSDRVRQAA